MQCEDSTKVILLIRAVLFPLLASENLENQHHASNYHEAKVKFVSQLQFYIFFPLLKYREIKRRKT